MPRFSGKIGIKTEPVETSPGIFSEPISEINVKGSMDRQSIRWTNGELNQDKVKANHILTVIVSEEVAKIVVKAAYVVWYGQKWTISHVEIIRPKIKFTLGGIYNAR